MPLFHVVFTGTRAGLSQPQGGALEDFFRHNALTLRHGCCIGGDEESHWAFRRQHGRGRRIQGHPSNLADKVVADVVADCDWLARPAPPLKRNLEMLGLGAQRRPNALCVGPRTLVEEMRSGTWMTVRAARVRRWLIYFFWPDGRVEEEFDGVRLPVYSITAP